MNLLYLMNIKLIILNIDGEKNCSLKCVVNTYIIPGTFRALLSILSESCYVLAVIYKTANAASLVSAH